MQIFLPLRDCLTYRLRAQGPSLVCKFQLRVFPKVPKNEKVLSTEGNKNTSSRTQFKIMTLSGTIAIVPHGGAMAGKNLQNVDVSIAKHDKS